MIDNISVKSTYTFSYFKYGDFKKGKNDFLGKTLPSVPKNTIFILADVLVKKNIYFNCTYYYATKIFLDDANTVATDV